MRFKTKDLMVSLGPKLELGDAERRFCLTNTRICVNPSLVCRPVTFECPDRTHITCFGGTFNCNPCSIQVTCARTFGCGGNSCGPGNSACDPTIFCGGSWTDWVIEDLEDIAAIRKDLTETLAQLDALQTAGLPSAIRTKADAEAIERSLTEALEQVRAQKKQLK